MGPPKRLIEGYRAFRADRYAREADEYRRLDGGQNPRVMIVACADSRVDPATIFAASPGELFVVRNVANLVPRHEPDIGRHGVSAAIEYAVKGLNVESIVVMGHARCGGIAACLKAGQGQDQGEFIGDWVALAQPAREQVLAAMGEADPDTIQMALEQTAIVHSIQKLRTFPFVSDAVETGRLGLHGAWFSIASGELHWLDPATGRFAPVPVE